MECTGQHDRIAHHRDDARVRVKLGDAFCGNLRV